MQERKQKDKDQTQKVKRHERRGKGDRGTKEGKVCRVAPSILTGTTEIRRE